MPNLRNEQNPSLMDEEMDDNLTNIIDDNDDSAHSSNEASSGVPQIKKARKEKTKPFTNSVHQFFDDNGNGGSRCILCSKNFTSKNPSPLIAHLKSFHPNEHKKFVDDEKLRKASKPSTAGKDSTKSASNSNPVMATQNITDCFRQAAIRRNGVKKNSPEYDNAIRMWAIAVVRNGLPYRLIEEDSIREALNAFALLPGPLIEFPHRRELSEKIGSLLDKIKSSLGMALQNAHYVSLTLDLWSRPGYSSAMMAVTLHFYDRKSKAIRRALLACRTIKQPHTGEHIFELFYTVREQWNLAQDQILRIVTDNGSNILKAFKNSVIILSEKQELEAAHASEEPFQADPNLEQDDDDDHLDETEFDLAEMNVDAQFSRKQRISCIDHCLMLVVRKAMESEAEVKGARQRAEELVSRFSMSPKATEELRKRSEGGIGLIKPVRTRWIYWYYVFERLIKVQRPLYEVCDDLKITDDLTAVDWKIIKELTPILNAFAHAVTRLEGEFYSTISEVYPMIYSLNETLVKFREMPLRLSVIRVIKVLQEEMDTRFQRVTNPNNQSFDPIYALASLLHPEHGLLVENDLFDAAKRELKLMVDTRAPVTDQLHNCVPPQPNALPNSSTLFDEAKKKIEERRRLNPGNAAQTAIDREMETYLDIVLRDDYDEKEKQDPFKFWSERSKLLPLISDIAVDVLSIPATSAPSERVFSRASYILDRKRHNLHDDKVEWELMFKMNQDLLNDY